MNWLDQAKSIEKDIVAWRRHIHANAEVGFCVENTAAFVEEKLKAFGYAPYRLAKVGVVATVGEGEPVILFRADMDAIPGKEASGVDFQSEENMHMCGHDMHTAMLLGAAKLLKAHESELNGTVKLVFQPAEELLAGAKALIDAGLLKNPAPEAAFMIHVNTMDAPALYIKPGIMSTTNNNFRITVRGKSAHGAMPQLGVDATYIGAAIVTALPEIIAREVAFDRSAVITTGHFEAGDAPNSIPDVAVIEGTLRSFSEDTHAFVKKRLVEVAKSVAETYRGTAEVEFLSEAYIVNNDPKLVALAKEAAENAGIPVREAEPVQASEDFSYIAKELPTAMMMLGVKPESGEVYPLHNQHAIFNEDSMVYGVSTFCAIAEDYFRRSLWQ